MLLILSPAKTQEFTSTRKLKTHKPLFANEAANLIKNLRTLNQTKIENLMNISPKLAQLNYQRFKDFNPNDYNDKNSKAAILAYQGDVYQGLDAQSLSDKDLTFANEHLLILSGLYGAIRPLDLIQAYRLEMSIKLSSSSYKNLYAFWHNPLNQYLNKRLKTEKVLINLASEEYFKVIDFKNLQGDYINIEFKNLNKGKYQIIGIHAKKARGLMARYIIENQIENPQDLKKFKTNGYKFIATEPSAHKFIFHCD